MELKNFIFAAVVTGLAAGCATAPVVDESPTFEPVVEAGAKEPNPFADYDTAMRSSVEFPLTVNWQDAHAAEIAAATKPEALEAHLKDVDSARKLLGQVGPAYKTDPIVLIQIGAVSQWVMNPACANASKLRATWTEALLIEIWSSLRDPYYVMFCLDQLRWCGRPEDARKLREVASAWGKRSYKVKHRGNSTDIIPLPQTEQDKEDTRHVREFAAQVEREIAK